MGLYIFPTLSPAMQSEGLNSAQGNGVAILFPHQCLAQGGVCDPLLANESREEAHLLLDFMFCEPVHFFMV